MSDPFVTRLRHEVEAWVGEGLVTPEQGRRLTARYPEGDAAPSRFVAILSLVGATLVASGVALVIAHNWERLSDGVKVGGLVALMTGLYAAAFELRGRALRRTGEALLMAAGALFLCGIALVGQIYHLNSRPPNAVLLWVAVILPIAYLLRAAPLFFLGAAGAVVWIGMEAARPDSILYVGGRGLENLGVGLQALAPAVGVLLISLGSQHHGAFAGFRRVLESLGLSLFLGGLYLLSFLDHRFLDSWARDGDLPGGPMGLFAALAVVAAALAWRAWPDPVSRRALFAGMLLTGILTAGAVLFVLSDAARTAGAGAVLAGWCWVLDVAAALVIVSIGLHWGRPGWINLGLLFIGLNIVTRYFDYFGTRLDQGLSFVGGGVLLIALSILLERQRRKLTRRAAEGGGA